MADQMIMNYTDTGTGTGSVYADLPTDMLEAVMTKLPTIDLLSTSCVSNEWLHAVRSSLRTQPRDFPWLILQCRPHPTACTDSVHALDPYSSTWLSVTRHNVSVKKQSPPNACFLRTSNGDVMYTLSMSQLVISKDLFGFSGDRTEVKGPKVWRQDPVVAEVDRWVVVVGGGLLTDLDDGEEEGAVEVYDKESGVWEMAEPMPPKFEGSTYSTWLSVAATDERLYVIEKRTGWISYFDPASKKWGPTRQLSPDRPVSKWAIGAIGKDRLMVVGAGSEGEESKRSAMKVRAWQVDGKTLQMIDSKPEEMPSETVDRLFPDFASLDDARQRACSVELRTTERGGYLFDPANIKNGVVMYRFSLVGGAEKRVGSWEWIPSPDTVSCDLSTERVSVGCSPVQLHEVARCFYNPCL